MSKFFIVLTVVIILITGNIVSTFWENGNVALSNGSGAPAAYTGSPGDGHICTSCHAGPTAATQTGWITSTIPVSGYVPNTTYTITATATRSNHTKFGFEVSPQNTTGALRGTLINTSAQTQLVGSNKYITHTASGTTGTTGYHTWTFNWTAPVAGTGAVTFYGAFCITNASNSNSGDTIYKSTLSVQEVPSPSASASVNNNVTCNGESNGSATVTAGSGTTPYTYSWNTSPVQTTATASGLPAGTYTVTVTDANLLTATSSVTITQPAAIDVALNSSTAICFGGCIELTASASGGNGNFSYEWNSGGSTNSITVCPTNLTTYSVVATDLAGCTGSNSTTITVNPLPVVTLSINPDTVCNNAGSFQLAGGFPAGGSYYGLGVSGGNFDPVLAGAGTHAIIYNYTDGNGCSSSDSSEIFVDICTGIQILSQPQPVTIFPNPNNGIFSVECNADQYEITVRDILGNHILTRKINTEKKATLVNLIDSRNGIYILQFITKEGTVSKKFQINK